MNGRTRHYHYEYNKKRLALIGIVSVVLLLVIYFSIRSFVASYYYNRALIALNTGGDLTAAEKNINWAITWQRTDVYYRTRSDIELARMKVLLAQNSVAPEKIQEEYKNLFTLAQKSAQAAVNENDSLAENWLQ